MPNRNQAIFDPQALFHRDATKPRVWRIDQLDRLKRMPARSPEGVDGTAAEGARAGFPLGLPAPHLASGER